LAGPLLGARSSEVEPLGDTDQQPRYTVLLWATASGRINRRASVVICFPEDSGSTGFLAISDPTDVGLSSALPLALELVYKQPLHLVLRLGSIV
jgi:hypothetical protein